MDQTVTLDLNDVLVQHSLASASVAQASRMLLAEVQRLRRENEELRGKLQEASAELKVTRQALRDDLSSQAEAANGGGVS